MLGPTPGRADGRIPSVFRHGGRGQLRGLQRWLKHSLAFILFFSKNIKLIRHSWRRRRGGAVQLPAALQHTPVRDEVSFKLFVGCIVLREKNHLGRFSPKPLGDNFDEAEPAIWLTLSSSLTSIIKHICPIKTVFYHIYFLCQFQAVSRGGDPDDLRRAGAGDGGDRI